MNRRCGPPMLSADPERFVFVRDGFYFWAFLLTPVWMLWHRLWLVLLIYLSWSRRRSTACCILPASAPAASLLVELLISLLVGLEAGTLRRFTLARRGWQNVGVVSGDDLEDAERRFFDAWARRPTRRAERPHRGSGRARRRCRRRARRTARRDRPVSRAGSATVSVAIVDYGSGNLHSAAKAFERAAHDAGFDQPIVVTQRSGCRGSRRPRRAARRRRLCRLPARARCR